MAKLTLSDIDVKDKRVFYKDVTEEEVNGALEQAAGGRMKGILAFCKEPLVSADFNGNSCSSIVDSLSTKVMEKRMVKIISWYDNEWGYSNRILDLARFIADQGL